METRLQKPKTELQETGNRITKSQRNQITKPMTKLQKLEPKLRKPKTKEVKLQETKHQITKRPKAKIPGGIPPGDPWGVF